MEVRAVWPLAALLHHTSHMLLHMQHTMLILRLRRRMPVVVSMCNTVQHVY